MHTMSTVSTRSIPMVPSQMAAPPPARQDLHDDGTVVGWIDGLAIGFRGFGDEAEAAHAAWVGYRTMSRRFSRVRGRRPIPIDSEPLSFDRSGDVELILAAGRPIATLVRPGAVGRSGPASFGFELQMPVPADELKVRSTADLVYRTMRRSGIRWTMWMPAAPAARGAPATAGLPQSAAQPTAAATGAKVTARSSSLATVLIVLALLATIALPAIKAPALIHLLGGAAALLALVALASLVRLVVTDARDVFSRRERATRAPVVARGGARGRSARTGSAGAVAIRSAS